MCTKCRTASLTKGHWHCACNPVLSLSLASSFTLCSLHLFNWCKSILPFSHLKTKPKILFWHCPLQPPSRTAKLLTRVVQTHHVQFFLFCSPPEHTAVRLSSPVPSPVCPCQPVCRIWQTAFPPPTGKPSYLAPSTQLSPSFLLLPLTLSQSLLLILSMSLTSKIKCAPRLQILGPFFLSTLGDLTRLHCDDSFLPLRISPPNCRLAHCIYLWAPQF